MSLHSGLASVTLIGLVTIGGGLSAPVGPSVNAESPPPVLRSVDEWDWRWDAQTTEGEFVVPTTYYDRTHGRTYTRGATTLVYQLRIPEDHARIRGLIVLVPGLDQHSGRYRHVVDRFRDEFILASCDARFMGRSHPRLAALRQGDGQPRGVHRALQRIRKFFYIVYDLDTFVHEILPRRLAEEGIEFEQHPLLLLGHSLGGLAVLDYVLGIDHVQPPDNLVGVILSSPALMTPREPESWLQAIIINYNYHVNASFGSRTEERTAFLVGYEQLRNILMTPIFYLISLTRAPVDNEWATQWVTDDPWEQIGFQTDPLTIRRNPLNFIYQVQEHMIEVRYRAREMRQPFLMMYAQGDRIVNPIGAERFAVEALHNHPLNRVVAVGDTYSHELFRARPAVRNRLLDVTEEWIDDLLASRQRE